MQVKVPLWCLKNEDCSGPFERDHVRYSSDTQPEIVQWLCRYHNRTEARKLRLFVPIQVLGGRHLTGQARIMLNDWHVQYGLHPRLKKRIHELSKEHPLPEGFIPGQGQRLADRAVAEGPSGSFRWRPDLCDGKIIGFWVAFEGQQPRLVR